MPNTSHLEDYFENAVHWVVSLSDRASDWFDMNFKKLRQWIGVPGNGILTERSYPVSSFLRLHLSLGGSVELIASDQEKVVIRTDNNLHDFIRTVNSGRTLYISASDKLQIPLFTELQIKVYIRQMDTLNIAHSGGDFNMTAPYESGIPLDLKVQSEGNVTLLLSAPSIKLLSQTDGNVRITGQCKQFSAKTQNNGDFDARLLRAEEVDFVNQSNGNAWIYASESLRIKHQGNGFVHYYGAGRLRDVKQQGNGVIMHREES